jgi:tetratricopeptide (TPR) repeat protein
LKIAGTSLKLVLLFSHLVIYRDPSYTGFIAKAYFEVGAYKEALTYSALELKVHANDPILLYYQAKSLLKLKANKYALVLAKYACELSPESTNAWILLAQAYTAVGNYKYALLAIDSAPVYLNEVANDSSFKKYTSGLPLNKPSRQDAIDSYPKFMAYPNVFDFELSRHAKALEKKTTIYREDEEQLNLLKQLGANKFSESEEEIYKTLSLIEKHIGWEALIELRDETFEKGLHNDWDNPKVAAECSNDEGRTIKSNQDSMSYAIIRSKGASNVF